MDTNTFLNTVANHRPYSQPTCSFFLKATQWIHSHATAVRLAEVAGMAFGGLSLAATPWAYNCLGGLGTVGLAVGGSLVAAISAVAYGQLEIVAPTHHPMTHRTFTPGSVEGGRLYYEGDVPILELDYCTPREAGYAHGYLLGPNIHVVRQRFEWVTSKLPQLFGYEGKATPQTVPEHLEALKTRIPNPLLVEMTGLVDGFNQWAAEAHKPPTTLDELLLWHLLPDAVHFRPFFQGMPNNGFIKVAPGATPACTSIVDRDPREGPLLARNMDWPTFGVAGSNSLVIKRKFQGDTCTVEVGIPALLGTVTGMNRAGVCLSMNICQGDTQTVEGIPSSLFNRLLLESVDSVKQAVDTLSVFKVLGPYHLILADEKEGAAVHFHQGQGGTHHRVVPLESEKGPLIVTNCRYEDEGCRQHRHYSEERNERLHALFQDARAQIPAEKREVEPLAIHALQMPYVNNFETAHTVVMLPRSRCIKLALDNAYSASAPLQLLTKETLFG